MNLTPQEQQSIQAIIGSAYQVRQENGHEVRELDVDVVTHGVWQLTLNKVKQLAQQGIWFTDEDVRDFFNHALAYAGSHYDESFSPINGAFSINEHYSDLYNARVNHFTSKQVNVVSADPMLEKELEEAMRELDAAREKAKASKSMAELKQEFDAEVIKFEEELNRQCIAEQEQSTSSYDPLYIMDIANSATKKVKAIASQFHSSLAMKEELQKLSADLAEKHELSEEQHSELLGYLEQDFQAAVVKRGEELYPKTSQKAAGEEVLDEISLDDEYQDNSNIEHDSHSSFSISVAINSALGALYMAVVQCAEVIKTELAETTKLLKQEMGKDSMLTTVSEKVSDTFGKFSGTFFSLADDFNNKAGKLDQTDGLEKSFSEMTQEAIDMQSAENNIIASF